MKISAAVALMLTFAGSVQAQDLPRTVTQRDNLAAAAGAMLRGLDKVAGGSVDLPVKRGETVPFGNLLVSLRECRYPQNDPASDAFAYLVIRDQSDQHVLFDGWMVASSPALNALDHPRYDVWVMRCSNT